MRIHPADLRHERHQHAFLDVYKRQAFSFSKVLTSSLPRDSTLLTAIFPTECAMEPIFSSFTSTPVSYTHLDVYKRQTRNCLLPQRSTIQLPDTFHPVLLSRFHQYAGSLCSISDVLLLFSVVNITLLYTDAKRLQHFSVNFLKNISCFCFRAFSSNLYHEKIVRWASI